MPTRYEDDKVVLAQIAADAVDIAKAAVPAQGDRDMRDGIVSAVMMLLGRAYLEDRTKYRVLPPPGDPAPPE